MLFILYTLASMLCFVLALAIVFLVYNEIMRDEIRLGSISLLGTIPLLIASYMTAYRAVMNSPF
jgi:hypothetical protein